MRCARGQRLRSNATDAAAARSISWYPVTFCVAMAFASKARTCATEYNAEGSGMC